MIMPRGESFSKNFMHLQQTKRASIATGGPQYYFHDLSGPVLTYLAKPASIHRNDWVKRDNP